MFVHNFAGSRDRGSSCAPPGSEGGVWTLVCVGSAREGDGWAPWGKGELPIPGGGELEAHLRGVGGGDCFWGGGFGSI